MITAKNLQKRYGSTVAVDNLSFEVKPGVVTGFLGPNGAGKSTTMRLMLDLDHGQGDTRFDGERYDSIKRPATRIGTLLEAKPFHPTRTARNHLRMLAAGSGIPNSRVEEVLDFVGLGNVKGKKPKGYSLGMAQRLGLAQALLGDPQTLILDEPANGLDPHGIHWMRDVLKSLANQGRTIFVSSHLLPEMQLMADELVVIGRGKMIFNGDVDEFVREFTQSHVVVRTPAATDFAGALQTSGATVTPGVDGSLVVTEMDIAAVGDLAHSEGVALHELSTQSASLEDAFISATGASEEYVATEVTGNQPPSDTSINETGGAA